MLLFFFSTFLISLINCAFLKCFSKRINLAVPVKPELGSHKEKENIPSMGGLAFVTAFAIASFIFCSFEATDLIVLLTVIGFAGIGLLDDWKKTVRKDGDGIKSITKLILQLIFATIAVIALKKNGADTVLFGLDLGWLYYPLAVLFVTVIVNAVNITDGLDGLATGVALTVMLAFCLFLKGGNAVNLTVWFMGALIGFLWFNSKPASVFMGDCGSHAIGAFLALEALVTGTEGMVSLSSSVFLLEFLSSFIQIVSIRVFKKKVFSIAPIHHIFQLKGVDEGKIVVSFVLLSLMVALAALSIAR